MGWRAEARGQDAGTIGTDRPLPMPPFSRIAASLTLALVAFAGTAPLRAADRPTGLLVVAPDAFRASLDLFVQWKATHRPVEVVVLEDVLKSSTGGDDPEKLKRHLFDRWKAGKAGYVLLVGDVDRMPVRFMTLDRVTPEAFNYSFYPSDLYYADLAKSDGSFDDWNGARDDFHAGYFGEVRGEANKTDAINFDRIDYRPDVAVGRWPAANEAEVVAMAAKTIAYEKAVLEGSQPALRKAAFFSVGGWVDSRGLLGGLAGKLPAPWLAEKRFHDTAGSPPPDHAQLKSVMNAGVGLLVHAGHGQPDSWEHCFNPRDLAGVASGTPTPVILSAGCSTAHFSTLPPYEAYEDLTGGKHRGTYAGEIFSAPPPPPAPYQRDAHNPTSLGELTLRRPDAGAVAYIGCNTGSQPCGLTLVEGFMNELATAPQPTLGDCWNAAVRHYHTAQHLDDLKPTDSWYPPSIFFQAMKFMVFGDPSLRMPGSGDGAVDLRPALEKSGLSCRGQGSRNTCSVFAVTGALEYAMAHRQAPAKRLSVEFLNWASNDAVGRAQDGGFFSDLWRGLEKHGICTEEAMPYARAFDPAAAPSDDARKLAAGAATGLSFHWIKRWDVKTGLTPEHLKEIRRTLDAGWPVCAGMRWPKREHWDGPMLRMTEATEVFDGHSVLLVGYRTDASAPGGGYFLMWNSNRPGPENRLPWAYAENYVNDAAWIDDTAASAQK